MGLEADCTAVVDGSERSGKAYLESTEIVLAGRPRLRIPLDAIDSAAARGAKLTVKTSAGQNVAITFEDAVVAKKWLEKLNEGPKSRLDKLGVERQQSILLLGDLPLAFREELGPALDAPAATRPIGARRYDMVILLIEQQRELARLRSAGERTATGGVLWAVWPKGMPDLQHEDVVATAGELGFSQTKSMSFDDQLHGLRLVRTKR
ncbi:MAG: hypothetical protein SGJ09_13370 [Phycisphaerae bacterium]|nr:hypothetical protein [Phycisphaerae bacterium]